VEPSSQKFKAVLPTRLIAAHRRNTLTHRDYIAAH
jgi:hypothetical protein